MELIWLFKEIFDHSKTHNVLPGSVPSNGTRLTTADIICALDQGAADLGWLAHTHREGRDGSIINISPGCLPGILIYALSL